MFCCVVLHCVVLHCVVLCWVGLGWVVLRSGVSYSVGSVLFCFDVL